MSGKKMEYSYSVVEDNAGGLYLYIWQGGRVLEAYHNLEYLAPEDFVGMLDAVEAGEDRYDWDRRIDEPHAHWEHTTSYEWGVEVIAEWDGDERTLYPDQMGVAGLLAFGMEAMR